MLPSTEQVTYKVVKKIRKLALQDGIVKTFKAYMQLSDQPSKTPASIRSELQSCGVSLIDCPHSGRKDVADKMMIGKRSRYIDGHPYTYSSCAV